MARSAAKRAFHWLLLIHSIPPQPAYFRAKVGRRLAKVGAVAIKNSVYVLPSTEDTSEDFQWITREIVQDGGEATVCEAQFIEGMQNEHIEALFRAARQADYVALADEARALQRELGPKPRKGGERAGAEGDLARLKKRLSEILEIDFFGAPGRESAEATIATIEKRLARRQDEASGPEGKASLADYRGRTWITRKNVHVDRIACAWLVRHFIDPKATLRFVPGHGYKAKEGEITFDMFEGTFTHIGDRCTFEVLLDTFGLKDPGLRAIAEIVHDIDVKDGKFERAEAPGFAALIAAIALTRREDEERIAFGGEVLAALLELYRRKRTAPEEG